MYKIDVFLIATLAFLLGVSVHAQEASESATYTPTPTPTPTVDPAILQLKADRVELKTRLLAIGGKMTDKHKTFSGISREMHRCGFKGNHAKIVWNWYKTGDKSGLDCLEAKHVEVMQEDSQAMIKKVANEAAIKAIRSVDCSLESGKMKVICNALQALIK